MLTRKYIIYIIFFCIFCLACTKKTEQNRTGLSIYTMQECEHKSFFLDDSTTQVLRYIQTFVENDSLKLALYNPPINNICFFDVESGKSIKKIQLFKDGPNALKENFMGFYYQSTDSLWVFRNWPEEICLVNSKGVIYWKKRIAESNSTQSKYAAPEILPNSNLPIKKVGDYLILQGQGFDRENSDKTPGVTLLYNIIDETANAANPYPAIYGNSDEVWQVFAYRMVPYDIIDDHKMVLSFPADDSLRIYNIKTGETAAHFAGHSINYNIKPSNSTTRAGLERHVLEQVQYPGIYYDKWNDLFYRVMTLPASDYDKNIGSKLRRELCVIILDKEFNKIGEYTVKERTHTYSHAFVSKEGLHINVMSDDDDYLTFITLKPHKL